MAAGLPQEEMKTFRKVGQVQMLFDLQQKLSKVEHDTIQLWGELTSLRLRQIRGPSTPGIEAQLRTRLAKIEEDLGKIAMNEDRSESSKSERPSFLEVLQSLVEGPLKHKIKNLPLQHDLRNLHSLCDKLYVEYRRLASRQQEEQKHVATLHLFHLRDALSEFERNSEKLQNQVGSETRAFIIQKTQLDGSVHVALKRCQAQEEQLMNTLKQWLLRIKREQERALGLLVPQQPPALLSCLQNCIALLETAEGRILPVTAIIELCDEWIRILAPYRHELQMKQDTAVLKFEKLKQREQDQERVVAALSDRVQFLTQQQDSIRSQINGLHDVTSESVAVAAKIAKDLQQIQPVYHTELNKLQKFREEAYAAGQHLVKESDLEASRPLMAAELGPSLKLESEIQQARDMIRKSQDQQTQEASAGHAQSLERITAEAIRKYNQRHVMLSERAVTTEQQRWRTFDTEWSISKPEQEKLEAHISQNFQPTSSEVQLLVSVANNASISFDSFILQTRLLLSKWHIDNFLNIIRLVCERLPLPKIEIELPPQQPATIIYPHPTEEQYYESYETHHPHHGSRHSRPSSSSHYKNHHRSRHSSSSRKTYISDDAIISDDAYSTRHHYGSRPDYYSHFSNNEVYDDDLTRYSGTRDRKSGSGSFL